MATSIKSIPILKDNVAKEFIDKAEENYQNKKGTVDFRRKKESVRKILKKGKLE